MINFFRSRAVRAFLSALLAGAAVHATAAARDTAERDPGAAALSYVKAEMEERQIPGLQLVVIRDGKVVLSKALGTANLQHGDKVSERSLFSINSATKSFTGVAIMQLAEMGKLDLAAPVSRYLPGLPAAWQGVTLTQLLNHTSGLPDIVDQSTSRMIVPGDAAAWAAVQALPVQFAPGERFSYNQTNYLLLGRIIDQLSGQPFADFVRQRQFEAVGMPHTQFGDSRDVIVGKADAYRRGSGSVRYVNAIDEFPAPLRTGAGIITSAGELARWLIALQQGRLLTQASLDAMWTPSTMAGGKPARWTQGWPSMRGGAHRTVAGIGGGRSAFFVYPDDKLAVIILSNLAGGAPETMIDAVASFYLPQQKAELGGALTGSRLRTEVARSGFSDLDGKLRAIRGKEALPNPGESDLNGWGYRLLAKGQVKPAIAVFELAARLYPDSWNAHDSLAEAQEAGGAPTLAVQGYRRSLALDPNNGHAKKRLRSLEQQ
jgi:CubicO group peptidase (beta-lactamase class C family)